MAMRDFNDIDGPEWLEYASRALRKRKRAGRGGSVVLLLFAIPATVFLAIIGFIAIVMRSAARHDDKALMGESLLLLGLVPFVVIFGICSLFVLSRRSGGFAWWYNAVVNAIAISLLAFWLVLIIIAAG